MAQEQVADLLANARAHLGAGEYEQALASAAEAVLLAPTEAEPQIQRGIALSSLGRGAEADDAFRRALILSPYSAKGRFNFAVHRYHSGDVKGALELAEEAVQLDPTHQSAADPAARIRNEAGTHVAAESVALPPVTATPVPDWADRSVPVQPAPTGHLIDFIGKLGPAWRAIGWVLAIVNLLAFFGYMRLAMQYQPATTGEFDRSVAQMAKDPLTQVVLLSLIATWFGIVVYSILDVVDRKASWLWMLPLGVCSCFLGWFFLPLYLVANRDR